MKSKNNKKLSDLENILQQQDEYPSLLFDEKVWDAMTPEQQERALDQAIRHNTVVLIWDIPIPEGAR